ncbi:VOC family protein [Sphingobium boeckii]|uniref:Catechol 2,3-dioxygenase-like lactoylglutathione lyase family enzyme n=1 Tax=Sphingobium boeckii TaxID=1082345 RepID=A0A7W9AFB4_9SPHN|nr:VOC family protein [Sphingobium boeckii]MBB5684523.1 catechol 2,3-dioxygenase-like lactoylglutathione lyase family enzyme [Sphingobium boeckii]
MMNCNRVLAIALTGFYMLAASELAAQEPAAAPPQTSQVALDMMGTGLRVADLTQSLRFFRDGLGMREVTRFSTKDFDEVVLGFGDGSNAPPIFLLQSRDSKAKAVRRPIVKGDKIILAVADISPMAARLAAMGYAPEPISRDAKSGVQQIFVADPDGHRFEIVQRAPMQR